MKVSLGVNPYLYGNKFFSDEFNPDGKVPEDFPDLSHRVFIDLDTIQAMWLQWHVDGPNKGTPKGWIVKLQNAEISFNVNMGNKIFEALKRYKGQV